MEKEAAAFLVQCCVATGREGSGVAKFGLELLESSRMAMESRKPLNEFVTDLNPQLQVPLLRRLHDEYDRKLRALDDILFDFRTFIEAYKQYVRKRCRMVLA